MDSSTSDDEIFYDCESSQPLPSAAAAGTMQDEKVIINPATEPSFDGVEKSTEPKLDEKSPQSQLEEQDSIEKNDNADQSLLTDSLNSLTINELRSGGECKKEKESEEALKSCGGVTEEKEESDEDKKNEKIDDCTEIKESEEQEKEEPDKYSKKEQACEQEESTKEILNLCGGSTEEKEEPDEDNKNDKIDDCTENKESKEEEEEEENYTEEEIERLRVEALEFKAKGNAKYKERKFAEAYQLYSEGIRICPNSCSHEKSILFGNRCACSIALNKTERAIVDCDNALKLNPNYVKVLLRRAQLLEESDKLDTSLADYQKVLELDPSATVARSGCMRLPKKIDERNEKMKEEMMGQLKKLGNMVLKPFGLSTNNFQMQQQEGGSYNIQFVQNQQGGDT